MQALWNEGWLGFVDNNLNGTCDAQDERILQREKADRGSEIAIILHARWKNIKFDARGVLRRCGHFRVCSDPVGPQKKSMQVIRMNTWGRLAV